LILRYKDDLRLPRSAEAGPEHIEIVDYH